MDIRKTLMLCETVLSEAGQAHLTPISRVAAVVVFRNPLAGQGYVEDLTPLFEIGAAIGEKMSADAVAKLGGAPISYGKAAIVGVAGDFEHGGAVLHPRLGKPMRAAVDGGKALIPSNVKVAAPGAVIDVPLGHKDDPWSFDHFDTMSICLPDSPRPQEIMMIMAFADGGRVNPRVGSAPVV
jgi:hypothetical protein